MTDPTRHEQLDRLLADIRLDADEDTMRSWLADLVAIRDAEPEHDPESDIEQSIQLDEQTRLDIARHARWTPHTTTPDAHDRTPARDVSGDPFAIPPNRIGERWRRSCCATWSDQHHAQTCENYGGR